MSFCKVKKKKNAVPNGRKHYLNPSLSPTKNKTKQNHYVL